MKGNARKKNFFLVVCALLIFVLLTVIIGMIIGYQLGMQTPIEKLGPSVSIQEVANINAIIYGIRAVLLDIIGSIVYASFAFVKKLKNKNKCPKCGANAQLSTDLFCRNCGSSLEK